MVRIGRIIFRYDDLLGLVDLKVSAGTHHSRVLVDHDDNLGEVVEFRDGADVIHGAFPLLVGEGVRQSAILQTRQDGVKVTFTREVETGAHKPLRRCNPF